jgi:membrane protease YdiL (CAAX protease family)
MSAPDPEPPPSPPAPAMTPAPSPATGLARLSPPPPRSGPAPKAGGCAGLVPLAIVLAALGAVILLPNLYSDPNGLDPYVLRASGVAIALLGLSFPLRRLASSRLILVSLVTITLSWSAFSAAPTLLYDFGQWGLRGMSGDQANLYASEAWFGVTAAILLGLWLVLRGGMPALRLRGFGWKALAASVGGVALFLLAVMLIPASLLGREGLAMVAIQRDAPWLVPANMLQGLAQELQFRGLLLVSLERVTTPFRANLAQAAVFGLAHLAIVYQGPLAPFVPITAALGFLLGYATQRTGSLWPAIVVHMAADVAVVIGVLPGLYGF